MTLKVGSVLSQPKENPAERKAEFTVPAVPFFITGGHRAPNRRALVYFPIVLAVCGILVAFPILLICWGRQNLKTSMGDIPTPPEEPFNDDGNFDFIEGIPEGLQKLQDKWEKDLLPIPSVKESRTTMSPLDLTPPPPMPLGNVDERLQNVFGDFLSETLEEFNETMSAADLDPATILEKVKRKVEEELAELAEPIEDMPLPATEDEAASYEEREEIELYKSVLDIVTGMLEGSEV